MNEILGRTIKIHLEDGTPTGLRIASIDGWTGKVLISTQTSFARLLARPELDKVGVYLLYGPDPSNGLQMRAYIGEAENLRTRLPQSAGERGFWEQAAVVSVSDDSLTKSHARYLEARLIEKIAAARRGALDNTQMPPAENRWLPEAERAYMERFLSDLGVVLPMIGFDLLRPAPQAAIAATRPSTPAAAPDAAPQERIESPVRFEIRHKSRVRAFAIEQDGEFVVIQGSEALRDTNSATNTYAELKADLVQQGVLAPGAAPNLYVFTRDWAFRSLSAAAAVVLDRNSNGRVEWKLVGSRKTYHQWQEAKALAEEAAEQGTQAVPAPNPTSERQTRLMF